MEFNKDIIAGDILSAIQKAHTGKLYYETLYEPATSAKYKNEFVFFIKPEAILKNYPIKYQDIVNLILTKIKEFKFLIKNIKVLSADYLKDNNIIAQHYGVINKIANDAKGQISESAKEEFEKTYNEKIENVDALGGFEFLQKYPEFTPFTLNQMWKNVKNQRLASGTYCEKLIIDFDKVYLLNGFHPFQLAHFTEKGRLIVVFTLQSDISWKEAREAFIGATDPNQAKDGSLRKELLINKENLGLPELSQARNGVHLSAGPVEALVELMRFSSDFSKKGTVKDYNDFQMGKLLDQHFNKQQIDQILNNNHIVSQGKETSVFDITELADSEQSIKILKEFFN